MSISQTPAYNLKVVLKETGIKADLLRAWERRYGLPMPQRSAGGHRLYSQYDVETIKWLLARQGEGLSISRAVYLWREMETGGRNPLAELRQTTAPAPVTKTLPVAQSSLDVARGDWLNACLAFNETLAEQTLNQAFALYPVESVCVDLLQRGLVEMGNLWYENRASVQQEHFASGLAMRRLDALLAASPPPTRSQTVLVGCPPNEWHSFTPLLLSLLLRRHGLNVIHLGANVPEHQFEETVQAVHADMVVLVAQQLMTAATLQQVAASLSAHGLSVGYGGRIFSLQPTLQNCIPAHFLGKHLGGAVENIDAMLVAHPQPPQIVLPKQEYTDARQVFLSRRAMIDMDLDENGKLLLMPLRYSSVANHFMSDNILAALGLGDMTYLDAEINWLHPLLATQKLPMHFVSEYFKMYRDVMKRQLEERAAPVVAWLKGQIEATGNI